MGVDGSQKYKPAEPTRTTEQWMEEEHPQLMKDISTHCGEYFHSKDEAEDLARMIFISIRQRLGKR